jgi:hypothetical protein
MKKSPGGPDQAGIARSIIPLRAHVMSANLRISASPTRSVRPTSVHVRESYGTAAWHVLAITVDGVVCKDGDPSYPDCRGNCWIDLEVECPHDHPPTEANPIELCGAVICEDIDLPASAGNTERDCQWAMDYRGHGSSMAAVMSSSGEWETVQRGNQSWPGQRSLSGEPQHRRPAPSLGWDPYGDD